MDKLRLAIAFDVKAEPYFVHCTYDLVQIGGKVPAIEAQKELSDLYERVARLEGLLKDIVADAMDSADKDKHYRAGQTLVTWAAINPARRELEK